MEKIISIFSPKFFGDRMAPKNYGEDLDANKTLCL